MSWSLAVLVGLSLAVTQPAPLVIQPGQPYLDISPADWVDDVQYFIAELERIHPDPYWRTQREDYLHALASVQDGARLQPGSYRALLAFLTANTLLGDGHISVRGDSVRGDAASSRYPVLWYEFLDGLFIVAADREYQNLVGGRVIRLGEYPTEQGLARLYRATRGDNSYSRKSIGAFSMRKPYILMGLGLARDDGTLPLTVRLRNGQSRSASLAPVATDRTVDWVFARAAAGPKGPFAHRDRVEELDPNISTLSFPLFPRKYWFELLPRLDAIYVKINRMNDDPVEPFKQFVERLLDTIDREKVERLIIDISHNGGGDGTIVLPLVHGIIQRPQLNRRGHLFTIIGRNTFSASMILAGFLERHTETLFVGEPSGGSTIHFGDPETVTLPNTGLQFQVSKYRYQNSWPWDHRSWLSPDLSAEVTSDDFFNSRDVAMAAIEEFIRHPWRPIADWLRELIDKGTLPGALGPVYREHKRAHPDLYGKTSEEEINGLAYELGGQGLIEHAISILRLNVESYPHSANAWGSLAEGVWTNGDLPEAARLYLKALEIDPSNQNARLMLAELEGELSALSP